MKDFLCNNAQQKRSSEHYVLYLNANEGLRWNEAQQFCRKWHGTSLASVTNTGKQSEAINLQRTTGGMALVWATWLGLTDAEREGQYKWADGVKTDYMAWGSKQPSNSNEAKDCVVLAIGMGYKWRTNSCRGKVKSWMCELVLPDVEGALGVGVAQEYHSGKFALMDLYEQHTVTQTQAENACQTKGMELASLVTEEDFGRAATLAATVPSVQLKYASVWIGLLWDEASGKWKFKSDADAVVPAKWPGVPPVGAAGDCAALSVVEGNYYFVRSSCSTKLPLVLCQDVVAGAAAGAVLAAAGIVSVGMSMAALVLFRLRAEAKDAAGSASYGSV